MAKDQSNSWLYGQLWLYSSTASEEATAERLLHLQGMLLALVGTARARHAHSCSIAGALA